MQAYTNGKVTDENDWYGPLSADIDTVRQWEMANCGQKEAVDMSDIPPLSGVEVGYLLGLLQSPLDGWPSAFEGVALPSLRDRIRSWSNRQKRAVYEAVQRVWKMTELDHRPISQLVAEVFENSS